MAINTSLLIAAPMLQDFLIGKDGQPLAAGIVTMYQDSDRLLLKNWFYQTNISGIQGDYTYLPLANPLTLTAVGTIQDLNGNDVIPFYYPYDEDDDTMLQPYYVTVVSSTNIPQWTRENFPFVAPGNGNTSDQSILNLVPNGQFLAHNNLPAVGTTVAANQVQNGVEQVTTATQGSTVLVSNTSVIAAQGGSSGWYYIKPAASTDTDFIQFIPIFQEPTALTGNPRYAIQLSCTSTSMNDTFKELRVRFNNVNHFASNTQSYTFSISGMNNNSGTIPVGLSYIKYFGSGGSSPIELALDTYALPAGKFSLFSTTPIIFGTNGQYTIGTNNDDYIELCLVLPNEQTYSLSLTDALLTPGEVDIIAYPDLPDNTVFSTGVAGSMPTPDPTGLDLYLPIILTPGGVNFDSSQIGLVYASFTQPVAPSSSSATNNLLLLDGSGYLTNGYSFLGIPYKRLQQKYFNTTFQIPIFGTGPSFANAYIDALSPATQIRLVTNTGGVVTVTADSVPAPTGFTIATAVLPTASSYGVLGQITNRSSTVFRGTTINSGPITNPAAGTTSFTFNFNRNGSNNYAIFEVFPTIASGLAGLYWTFTSVSGGNFYVWYTVNGSGADPAPGGTGIKVALLSTYSAAEVNYYTCEAINAYQVSTIICTAASAITNGAYFTFFALTQEYYVWYNKGSATDPKPANSIGIQVVLTGTETATQVASKTQLAINSYSFAVPNPEGLFLRGVDPNGTWDFDNAIRGPFVDVSGLSAAHGGTFEYDDFLSHTHTYTLTNESLGAAAGGSVNDVFNLPTSNTGAAGGDETRPVNMDVYWVTKY